MVNSYKLLKSIPKLQILLQFFCTYIIYYTYTRGDGKHKLLSFYFFKCSKAKYWVPDPDICISAAWHWSRRCHHNTLRAVPQHGVQPQGVISLDFHPVEKLSSQCSILFSQKCYLWFGFILGLFWYYQIIFIEFQT